MSLVAATGAKARFLVDTALPFDGSSINLELNSENLEVSEELINPDGLRGTRARKGTKTRRGRKSVSGTISLPATPAALGVFLQAGLGGTPASGVYDVAEDLPTLQFLIDGGDQIRHVENAVVSQIEVISEPGQPVTLSLTIEAEDINEDQTWPVSPPSIADDPIFIHSDYADADLGALAMQTHRQSWAVNNAVSADVFANSTTRVGRLLAQDRIVTGSLEIDAISENADAIAGQLSNDLELEAVSGTWTWTMLFGMVQFGQVKPVTAGKNPRNVTLGWTSRQGSNATTHPDVRATLVSS